MSIEQRSDLKVMTTFMAEALPASTIVDDGKPFIMYGTAWKREQTAKYVQQAIHTGFRFIDTACQPKHYNEEGVGAGWSAAAYEMGLALLR